jgi:hypothetical protein
MGLLVTAALFLICDGTSLSSGIVAGRTACLISFSHPSSRGESNWGLNHHTPYLLNIVEPTIARVP